MPNRLAPLHLRKRLRPYQSNQRQVTAVHFLFLSNLAAATLSFTGPTNLTAATSKGITGGLSFTGPANLIKAISKGLTAGGLSFVGAFVKLTSFHQTGVLSFTGPTNLRISIAKSVAGGLSFTGLSSRSIATGLAAAVSFTGGFTKRTAKGLAAASLSFSGSNVRNIGKAFSAALNFTGTFGITRLFNKAFTAAVSFTGANSKAIGKNLSSSLSFVGVFARLLPNILIKGHSIVVNAKYQVTFQATQLSTASLTNIHWYFGTFKRISTASFRAVSRAIKNYITQKQED